MQLTPQQQMFIASIQPQGIGDIGSWIGDHWSSPSSREDINTTYYPQHNQRPSPNDAYYQRLAAQHLRQMRQDVRRFGGDTPESRQQYRSDFYHRGPLGVSGLPSSGISAWIPNDPTQFTSNNTTGIAYPYRNPGISRFLNLPIPRR